MSTANQIAGKEIPPNGIINVGGNFVLQFFLFNQIKSYARRVQGQWRLVASLFGYQSNEH